MIIYQKPQWKLILGFLLVYVITFCIILPIIGYRLPFSPYYVCRGNEKQRVNEKNKIRLLEAEKYLKSLDTNEANSFYSSQLGKTVDVAFMVITRKRKTKLYTGYLTQVVATLDEQLSAFTSFAASVIICNTDSHPENNTEVNFIQQYFPIVQIYKESPASKYLAREQEKVDLQACFETVYKQVQFKYLVVLQDDAVPRTYMLFHLDYIIKYRLERTFKLGELVENRELWSYVRLYYPEEWQGFGFETNKIIELISIGSIFAGTGMLLIVSNLRHVSPEYLHTKPLFLLLFLYGVMLALFIGRPYVIEFRRLSSQLLSIYTGSRCCMPATLYPRSEIPLIASYLSNITCNGDYPLDIALADFAINRGFKTYSVEPNLFYHIGMYSTLTEPKNAVNFQR